MNCLEILTKIPKGRVIGYSTLAKICKTSPRAIGRMLSANTELDNYPCYRVVKKNGEIGGYKLGISEKIRRLKRDGIKIITGKIPKEFFCSLKNLK